MQLLRAGKRPKIAKGKGKGGVERSDRGRKTTADRLPIKGKRFKL